MKFKTLILAFLLSVNTFALEQLFVQANEAYANSNYNTAITLYDSIISSGRIFYTVLDVIISSHLQ